MDGFSKFKNSQKSVFRETYSFILGRSYGFLKSAKTKIKNEIYEKTYEKVDQADKTGHGGTSTNGNTCRNALGSHRNVLSSFIPEPYRKSYSDVILRLWVIVRV